MLPIRFDSNPGRMRYPNDATVLSTIESTTSRSMLSKIVAVAFAEVGVPAVSRVTRLPMSWRFPPSLPSSETHPPLRSSASPQVESMGASARRWRSRVGVLT